MSGNGDGAPGGADRQVRIAAVGDLHYDGGPTDSLRDLFSEIDRSADILVLCGDLTTHGKVEQMRGFVEQLKAVRIPTVAVLGNHDHEADQAEEVSAVMREGGVHVLDGDSVVIDGVGFAGTKGFAGGFGRGALAPFGEQLIKDFVQAAMDEAIKIENALRNLRAHTKIVVLHFAPLVDTVLGEPEIIYPFLGSSRLLDPIETIGAHVVFHGHAHHGRLSAVTPSGIPVFNVSYPLLEENDLRFRIWTTSAGKPEQADSISPHEQPATRD
jgi:Icc-related predicted phosphoesterase